MSPPRPARSSLSGFTLVELLVVIVIIGLVAAATLLSLGGSGKDTQLERERDRLGALIDYVRERAALQTVEYGLRCAQDGYRFVLYDNRQARWIEDPLDETLRVRRLPDGLDLALVVEDRAIVLPRSVVLPKDAKGNRPAVAPNVPLDAATARTNMQNQPRTAATALGGAGTSPGVFPDLTPQVMLYSSGDLTRFKLTLSRTGTERRAVLSGTSAGKFEVGAVLEKPT